MAHIETGRQNVLHPAGKPAQADHVQRAQIMLVAAGVTAFAIVAVAATVMTTLL